MPRKKSQEKSSVRWAQRLALLRGRISRSRQEVATAKDLCDKTLNILMQKEATRSMIKKPLLELQDEIMKIEEELTTDETTSTEGR